MWVAAAALSLRGGSARPGRRPAPKMAAAGAAWPGPACSTFLLPGLAPTEVTSRAVTSHPTHRGLGLCVRGWWGGGGCASEGLGLAWPAALRSLLAPGSAPPSSSRFLAKAANRPSKDVSGVEVLRAGGVIRVGPCLQSRFLPPRAPLSKERRRRRPSSAFAPSLHRRKKALKKAEAILQASPNAYFCVLED